MLTIFGRKLRFFEKKKVFEKITITKISKQALITLTQYCSKNQVFLHFHLTGFKVTPAGWEIYQLQQYQKNTKHQMLPKRRSMRDDQDQIIEISQQNSTQHRLLQNNQIEELYNDYRRMKSFSEIQDQEPFEKLEEIIIRYCGRTLNFNLSPKNVMDILDKRIQRMLKNRKYKKNWSQQDTKILLWTFSRYAYRNSIISVDDTKEEDWINISKMIPGSNPDSCMFKVLSLKKVKLSQKKWTQIEENILSQIVKKSKKRNWRLISQELFKSNNQRNKIFRNAKQCKEHWVCYLNPELKKGPWDQQEDKNLMQYVFVNNGVKKWAQIAKIFKGRTQNALKNRFTLIIERLRKQRPSINSEIQLIEMFLDRLENGIDIQNNNHGRSRSLRIHDSPIQNNSASIVQQQEHQPERRQNSQNRNQVLNSENIQFQGVPMVFNSQPVLMNNMNYYQFCIPTPTVPNCFWIFTKPSN